MPRGSKQCSCGHICGPRSFVCPACNTSFSFKSEKTHAKAKRVEKVIKTKKGLAKVDWKSLKKGDMILVKRGPFWANSSTNYVSMGYSGRCKVFEVQEKGLVVFNEKEGGYGFIYMGESDFSEETGIYNEPHLLRLLVV